MATDKPQLNEKTALNVTWLGVIANLFLSIIKALAGIFFNSVALISDAGHSISDLISDAVTIWAIKISHKPSDSSHPYGHGRFETIGTLVIALMLIATGVGIFYHSIQNINRNLSPGIITIWVAVFSILVKEVLYQISASVGKKQKNRLLTANAWHHRTDAISSIIALIGIVGSRMGYPVLDPIAAVLVSGWIIKTGATIGYDAFKELTDTQLERDILRDIQNILNNIDGVLKYHELRARRMGSHILIDLHIEVRWNVSVSVSHQVAERVRRTILNDIPQVTEVLVHVDSENDLYEDETKLMRPQKEIEQDIVSVTNNFDDIKQVSHIICHYLKGKLFVQMEIELNTDQTIQQAKAFVNQLKMEIKRIPDIDTIDIHLEL
jgi:cation diffusion facilitator family transporter